MIGVGVSVAGDEDALHMAILEAAEVSSNEQVSCPILIVAGLDRLGVKLVHVRFD